MRLRSAANFLSIISRLSIFMEMALLSKLGSQFPSAFSDILAFEISLVDVEIRPINMLTCQPAKLQVHAFTIGIVYCIDFVLFGEEVCMYSDLPCCFWCRCCSLRDFKLFAPFIILIRWTGVFIQNQSIDFDILGCK